MPYQAAQIANYFIQKGLAENVTVDPLKVQKLVYFAHGWNLAFYGSPLIAEAIEAWRYGSVVPTLYRKVREYGYSTISKTVPELGPTPLDTRTLALLRQIWEKYGKMDGIELSALTHEIGYAWDLARRQHDSNWSSPNIPNEWIKDEFERRRAKG